MIKVFRGILVGIEEGENNGDILHIAIEEGRKGMIREENWIEISCRKGEWTGWNIGAVKFFRADVKRRKNTRLPQIVFLSLVKERTFKNELWKKEKADGKNLDFE
jgi:hypothetical protein